MSEYSLLGMPDLVVEWMPLLCVCPFERGYVCVFDAILSSAGCEQGIAEQDSTTTVVD